MDYDYYPSDGDFYDYPSHDDHSDTRDYDDPHYAQESYGYLANHYDQEHSLYVEAANYCHPDDNFVPAEANNFDNDRAATNYYHSDDDFDPTEANQYYNEHAAANYSQPDDHDYTHEDADSYERDRLSSVENRSPAIHPCPRYSNSYHQSVFYTPRVAYSSTSLLNSTVPAQSDPPSPINSFKENRHHSYLLLHKAGYTDDEIIASVNRIQAVNTFHTLPFSLTISCDIDAHRTPHRVISHASMIFAAP
jgi:hypothetical protein